MTTEELQNLSEYEVRVLEREWHRYESKVSDIILDGTTFELHIYENDPHIPHFYIIRDGFKCAFCLYEPRYYGPYKDRLTDEQLESLQFILTYGTDDYLRWSNLVSTYESANYVERYYIFDFKEDYKKSDDCPQYFIANVLNAKFEDNQQYVDLFKMYIKGIEYFSSSMIIRDKINLNGEYFRIRFEFEPGECSSDFIRDDIFVVDNPYTKCSFMIHEPKYYKYTQDKLSDKQLEELTEILRNPPEEDFPESTYQLILNRFNIQGLEYPDYKLANKEEN